MLKAASTKKRVIIIGAGPGGLASAMQLAHAGLDVTLLESRDRAGGRCSAIESSGFRFDVGPTFFLYPRVLAEIFRSIGRDLATDVPMVKLDPQYRVTFGGGGRLDCTPDIPAMEKQVADFSPSDHGALTRYMRDNRIKLEKFRPILESAFDGPLSLLRPDLLGAAPYVKPWRSLGQELQSYFNDPRLVIAFSFQSKYLGMSPFRCPSLFSILSYLEYEHGVFHPFGGCSKVSERMAEIAQEMGVDVRYNEPVTELVFDGKRVVAAKTAEDTYPCDALVMNADFGAAMEKLVPNHLRRRWSDDQLQKKRYSCSTFMMYLGVDGTFPDLAHHNIHIAADYERNLDQIENQKVLPDEPSFYVQNPVRTDRSMAPAGKSAMYVLVPVPNLESGIAWDAEQTRQFRELTLTRLQEIGIDDLESRIEFEQIVTPRGWKNDFNVYRGATFNLAHNLGQMLHLRPRNRFEELDGVYLVGGGTHPGSGLPVIYESTRISGRKLLADLGVEHEFMQVPEETLEFDAPVFNESFQSA